MFEGTSSRTPSRSRTRRSRTTYECSEQDGRPEHVRPFVREELLKPSSAGSSAAVEARRPARRSSTCCGGWRPGGLVTGTSGQRQRADAESGLVAISPTSIPYDRLRPEDVSVVEARRRAGRGSRAERRAPMHLAIQSGRPEVGAIVHTHSPYATALAAVVAEIPVVVAEQAAAVAAPCRSSCMRRPGSARWARQSSLPATRGPRSCAPRAGVPGAIARGGAAVRVRGRGAAQVYAIARQHGEPVLLPEDELVRLNRLRLRPRASAAPPARSRRSRS